MAKQSTYINDYAKKSDVGSVRISNQDRVEILTNKSGDVLLMVADGMGGNKAGDFASKIAVDYISAAFKKRNLFTSIIEARYFLKLAINGANKKIYNYGSKSDIYKGMGTTIVAVLIHKNYLICMNVGDSRCYMLDKGTLKLLSEDQSYVAYLKRSGVITDEEAENRTDKNILTSSLGIYPSTSINMKILQYKTNPIMLCSDGLTNTLTKNEIKNIMGLNMSAQEKVNAFITKANSKMCNDNISVIYFERRISQ